MNATPVLHVQAMHHDAIRRMEAAHARFVQGFTRVAIDEEEAGFLVYFRGEERMVRFRYELLAAYDRDLWMLRWGWADQRSLKPKSVDAVYHAAHETGCTSLGKSPQHEVHPEDAERLVALGGHFAQARGVWRSEQGGVTTWLALFPAPLHPAPRSIVTPAPIRTVPPPSLGAPSFASPASPVAPPSLGRIQQLAEAARLDLRMNFAGFREALVTLRIDLRQERARFVVQACVIDGDGLLEVLEPSAGMMDACTRFILEDATSGNGRWRKLTFRLAADALGASVVEIAAV